MNKTQQSKLTRKLRLTERKLDYIQGDLSMNNLKDLAFKVGIVRSKILDLIQDLKMKHCKTRRAPY